MDVGRYDVAQALIISLMVRVIDEVRDLNFEIAGQEVGFGSSGFDAKARSCLEFWDNRERRANASCLFSLHPFSQFAQEVTGAIVA